MSLKLVPWNIDVLFWKELNKNNDGPGINAGKAVGQSGGGWGINIE